MERNKYKIQLLKNYAVTDVTSFHLFGIVTEGVFIFFFFTLGT